MKPMKVLQVIDRLDAGGAERVMVDLSNILADNGHLVTSLAILNHGELGKFLNPEIAKVDLNRSGRFNLKKLKSLSVEANKHDIVHVHMRHNLKYVWLANKLFPIKAKIIFHDHYGKIAIDKSVSKTLAWALKKVTYIGVSQELADWARQHVGMPSASVFHLTNIVIRKNAGPGALPTKNAKQLVMVSNIRREKNIEFALSIMKVLGVEDNANLTIYGKIVDEEYFKELKDMVSSFGINDHIRFIDDCIDIQSQLPKYNFGLHTAKSETGPLVLIEYLAQGIPFLTFNTGEVVQQIRSKLSSFILTSFEVLDWVNTLRVHWDKSFRDELISIYQQQYSTEKYYQECLKIYQKNLTY